jgi:hypothetical protein
MKCTCPLNIGWTKLGCPGHGIAEDGFRVYGVTINVWSARLVTPKREFDINIQGDEDGQ